MATLPLAADHANRINRDGIEHIHAHYATYPALAAWFTNRLTGVPYSFTAHAHDLFIDQSMVKEKVMKATFVVAISRFNERFLLEHVGDSTTPMYVIHCGVNPDAYAFDPRDAPMEGPVQVICVGSLEEYKGHKYLLEGLGAPELERLRVRFVGEGPLRDDLERLARELGVSDRVEWMGELDEVGVADLLAQSDLFVLPSVVGAGGQMEGLPMAIVEALASGVAVVSTRLSAIPEVIEDGTTGFLAAPADAESLVDAIQKALRPTAIDHEAGRRLVESEFDVQISGRAIADLLCEET